MLKKILCLFLSVFLFTAASSICNASQNELAAFQGLIYSVHGGARHERITPEDFFLTPHFGHSKTFFNVPENGIDCKETIANAAYSAEIAAIVACEVRFTKTNFGNDFAHNYFATRLWLSI